MELVCLKLSFMVTRVLRDYRDTVGELAQLGGGSCLQSPGTAEIKQKESQTRVDNIAINILIINTAEGI